MTDVCFVEVTELIDKLTAKVTDWHNAASRHQDEAEGSKKIAKEWKKKSDAERKKR